MLQKGFMKPASTDYTGKVAAESFIDMLAIKVKQ